jgi:hypothetical protein
LATGRFQNLSTRSKGGSGGIKGLLKGTLKGIRENATLPKFLRLLRSSVLRNPLIRVDNVLDERDREGAEC